jgi:hypothetical protein
MVFVCVDDSERRDERRSISSKYYNESFLPYIFVVCVIAVATYIFNVNGLTALCSGIIRS